MRVESRSSGPGIAPAKRLWTEPLDFWLSADRVVCGRRWDGGVFVYREAGSLQRFDGRREEPATLFVGCFTAVAAAGS